MLVNHNIIDNLCKDAGESRTQKALRYKEQERVKIKKYEYENPMNFEISAEVEGSDIYDTYILVKNGEIENITCDCPDYYNYYGVCKHTLATVLKFSEYSENERKNKELTKVKKKKEYINLLILYYSSILSPSTILILVAIPLSILYPKLSGIIALISLNGVTTL